MENPCFIMKDGCYYKSNNTGYTDSILEAGIYSEEDAKAQAASCSDLVVKPVSECVRNTEYLDSVLERIFLLKNAVKAAEESDTGKYTVSFSIDGWRGSLSRTLGELRNEIKELYEDDSYIDDFKESLEEKVNDLICSSNSFNCVSIPQVADFNPMGHVELELLNITKS